MSTFHEKNNSLLNISFEVKCLHIMTIYKADNAKFISKAVAYKVLCSVHGREVQRQPRNHKVLSSIPCSGCQLLGYSLAKKFGASTGVVAR